jgi:hypothetical protein
VSVGRRYAIGLVAVAALATLASHWLSPEARRSLGAALGLALGVQGPLGWWLIRSTGSRRFLVVWAIGLGTRLALLAVVALVVAPAIGWALGPLLLPLAALLLALLLVEGIVMATARAETPAK